MINYEVTGLTRKIILHSFGEHKVVKLLYKSVQLCYFRPCFPNFHRFIEHPKIVQFGSVYVKTKKGHPMLYKSYLCSTGTIRLHLKPHTQIFFFRYMQRESQDLIFQIDLINPTWRNMYPYDRPASLAARISHGLKPSAPERSQGGTYGWPHTIARGKIMSTNEGQNVLLEILKKKTTQIFVKITCSCRAHVRKVTKKN